MIKKTETEIMQNWTDDKSIPIVSICCITYNQENYIEKTINSFLDQVTSFPFEIIIGEDCSTDLTSSIVQDLKNKYPAIITILDNENNLGMMKNFERTLKAARGKYIAFCEGDDYWIDSNKLQEQVNFLDNNNNFSMCFHNVNILNENDSTDFDTYKHLENKSYSIYEILSKWTVPTCSVVFKRTVVDKIPFNNKFKVGDNVLFTACSIVGEIFCINKKMGIYRKCEGGITNSLTFNNLIEHWEEMKLSFPEIPIKIFTDIIIDLNIILLRIYIRESFYKFFTHLIKLIKLYKFNFIKKISKETISIVLKKTGVVK